MTNEEIKLKPCPFCGSDKIKLSRRQIYYFGQNYRGQRKIKYGEQVICNRCHARGSLYTRTIIFPSENHQEGFAWLEAHAADAWNRRAKDAD